MKDLSSQPQIDLTPKPNVTKINRSVFYIGCMVVVVVCSVLFYSISKPAKNRDSKTDSMPAISAEQVMDDQSWYENASDALPAANKSNVIAANPAEDSKAPESNNIVTEEVMKKNQESLKMALDSSIKAPNINSNSFIAPSSVSPTLDSSLGAINNSGANLNSQDEKENFLRKFLQKSNPDYLHETVKKPLSPYEVKTGTVIPAVLAGGINSDLPGQLTALVSQNVFDSVRGQYLLIPQGSKLILQYDSHVAYGQQRLLVAVKRLIFPNGNSLDLDGMPGVDASGYGGLHDEVSNHYARIFGSSAIMGLITGGFQLSQPQHETSSNDPSAAQVMSGALGQQMGQVATGMMGKNLEIQPTLTIRPGYEFNVTVTADLVFPGPYQD